MIPVAVGMAVASVASFAAGVGGGAYVMKKNSERIDAICKDMQKSTDELLQKANNGIQEVVPDMIKNIKGR